MIDGFSAVLTPPPARYYQSDLVEAARRAASAQLGPIRLIVQGETGSGKSCVASHMICNAYTRGKKSLFVARGRSLVHQMAKNLARCNLPVGVIMSGEYPSMAPVQVASKDTLCSRFLRGGNWEDFPEYDLVIFDECHDRGKEWNRLIEKFRVSIGLTATPATAEGEGLGAPWKGLVCCAPPSELIKGGFLVPSRVFAPHIPDLRKCKKNANGDFSQTDLAKRMDKTSLVGDVVSNWKKFANGRPTIVFGVTIEHAKHIRDCFNQAGIRAAHIDETTSDDERENIMQMTANGFNTVITNVMVLSRGIDLPCISCVVLVRPTNSFVLYRQAIGRGKRPDASKDDLVVIDHAGACYRHGMPDDDVEWRLGVDTNIQKENEKNRDKNPKAAPVLCPKCHAMFSGKAACPNCGHRADAAATRRVMVGKGLLVEVEETAKPTEQEEKLRYWKKCLFVAAAKGGAIVMARAMYRSRFNEWPNEAIQPMPPSESWKLKVEEVYPWSRRKT